MNSKKKYCFVPSCPNNSHNNPDVLFVKINQALLQKWCPLVGKDVVSFAYCCDKHLNLEEDMENYQYWKMMGGKVKLKPTAKLINFEPLADPMPSSAGTSTSAFYIEQPGGSKRLKLDVQSLEELSESTEVKCINFVDIGVQCSPKRSSTEDKSVAATPSQEDKATNYRVRKLVPLKPTSTTKWNNEIEEESDKEGQRELLMSPSFFGSTTYSSSVESSSNYDTKKTGREHIIQIINKRPQTYLGLPKKFLWLLEYLCNQHEEKTKKVEIMMDLFRIRQNDTLRRMADQWEVSLRTAQSIMARNIHISANFFQNFIFMPTQEEVKRNLPLAFKINYSNVHTIIDCFEIEIQKPQDPVKQAQTWSQYKSCNTFKYLIGCTPNDVITFISEGYGGRVSDKALTEDSGLIEKLSEVSGENNIIIMADRGFKEVEAALATKNIKLLRPPSVYTSTKPTKKEVTETKVIASLRVHVERVIRRIREFKMLKPNSVIHRQNLKYIDKIVIIACGLIHLQGPVVK